MIYLRFPTRETFEMLSLPNGELPPMVKSLSIVGADDKGYWRVVVEGEIPPAWDAFQTSPE